MSVGQDVGLSSTPHAQNLDQLLAAIHVSADTKPKNHAGHHLGSGRAARGESLVRRAPKPIPTSSTHAHLDHVRGNERCQAARLHCVTWRASSPNPGGAMILAHETDQSHTTPPPPPAREGTPPIFSSRCEKLIISHGEGVRSCLPRAHTPWRYMSFSGGCLARPGDLSCDDVSVHRYQRGDHQNGSSDSAIHRSTHGPRFRLEYARGRAGAWRLADSGICVLARQMLRSRDRCMPGIRNDARAVKPRPSRIRPDGATIGFWTTDHLVEAIYRTVSEAAAQPTPKRHQGCA